MQESSQSTFSGKGAWNGALVQQKIFHLLLSFFLIHFPRLFSGLFNIRHTNPCHDSLRVILSVPADDYSAIWSRSSRSFISPSRITEKLLTTFPLLVRTVYNYIMQIFYAFLCIFFLFFPISFKLLPLCTSELCWSQRSNRLKTCVQVKWLHLWPQTIPSWEHLIFSNQMYFYFNGMLFAWGKLCGSPSDVFSFYHFVEKCINPFCFTSGFLFNTALGFPPLSAALPMAPVQKTKQSNMKLSGPKRCVKNESWSWL